MEVSAALGCAALAGTGAALVPSLIARVPEPAPDPEAPAGDRVKEPYRDIARRRGLRWKAVLAAALAGLGIGARLGWEWPLLFLLPLVPVLLTLAVIDWRTHLLPTKVLWPTTLALIAAVVITWAITRDTSDLTRAGWGFLTGYGTFYLLWFVYPKGLGFGDVRLAGVLGMALGYLGWGELLVGLYAGFLLGGVGGGLLSVLRVVERRAFPFGPFMVVGAWLGVLCGAELLDRLVAG